MNERERVLAVLGGKIPDKIPWFADLSYLYDSMKTRGILEDRYNGDEGYVRFHKDLGAGLCFYAPFLWKIEYAGGIKYYESETDGVKTFIFNTPEGNIRSEQKYLPTTYTWAYTEHFVKDIKDLYIMLYIFENIKYIENYKDFNKIDMLWGDAGIPVGLAPISVSPIQKLLTRWAGIENTLCIFMDNRDEFEEIIGRLKSSEDEVFEILKRSPARLIEFPENLSSEITGKTFFEKYSFDYYRKRINQLHDAGKYVSIHIDGTLKGCLPLLEKAGFDVAEAVTPAPVGDIEVENLRNTAGDKIILWGGLPGALFSPIYSESLFEEHLKNVLSTLSTDSRFVMGVADQVPPDGLISRVKKVRDMIEKWR